MEPISNNQTSSMPQELSSVAGRAFASFNGEMRQLIDMTENEKLPEANLGAKVDIRV